MSINLLTYPFFLKALNEKSRTYKVKLFYLLWSLNCQWSIAWSSLTKHPSPWCRTMRGSCCLVPRPQYSARPKRFVTWSKRNFVSCPLASDTSPKRIDQEGLGTRRTETRQEKLYSQAKVSCIDRFVLSVWMTRVKLVFWPSTYSSLRILKTYKNVA